MSDEARIARLRELARRVWPDLVQLRVREIGPDIALSVETPAFHRAMVSVPNYPRAFDALEAALLAMLRDGESSI